MNILGLISQLIGIKTLRLTDLNEKNWFENGLQCLFGLTRGFSTVWRIYLNSKIQIGLKWENLFENGVLSTPAEKSSIFNLNSFYLFLFEFLFFLDTDPHLASVCVISISFPFRDTSCVCVGTCVRVCVWAQIWSRHQSWEILRCSWAPMSNRFYLV